MTFNGLIRHYYQRDAQYEAEITVNLVAKEDRSAQSHDIAKAIRTSLVPIAARYGAKLKTVEVPPGPPVMQTLVAEVYGPTEAGRLAVAAQVRDIMGQPRSLAARSMTVSAARSRSSAGVVIPFSRPRAARPRSARK